ncbi:hypothetical protein I4U23_021674 [Adineta vaga]|nr:hypothetical protein I4U23_021674 [Adineta vaga]
MMVLLYFILFYSMGECAQPYFPSQITFHSNENYDGEKKLVVVDEINQRAFQKWDHNSSTDISAYAMKHIPYAFPDSPQSKYYVQLYIYTPPPPPGCWYATYTIDGHGNPFNTFPDHWVTALDSFEIRNYVDFKYEMIHSNQSKENEDYWYSNKTCELSNGKIVPCQEIYFEKNTDRPIRSTRIDYNIAALVQKTTEYKVLSIGKPDEKYFNSIPQNWTGLCADARFQIQYDPGATYLYPGETVDIQVWLTSAPHKVNGNDTVRIQWKADQYPRDFTLIPKELYFNSENFSKKQTLTVQRHEGVATTVFYPTLYGGGLEPVFVKNYYFTILS